MLVEDKAHMRELLSSPCAATAPASRARIAQVPGATKAALGAEERSDRMVCYYQYANRLAHPWWLHEQGIEAHLLFVNAVGDTDMKGPATAEAWHIALQAADYALGLPSRHALSAHVHHVTPDCRTLPPPT